MVFGKQIGAGLRICNISESRRRTAVQHAPALLARCRTDVDQPVGTAHGFDIMLDHKQCVAVRLQALQRLEQRLAIRRMQTGRRFVQDINHPEQLRTQLRGQAQALQLARRQGRRTAFQREITQAEIGQGADPLQQILSNALRRQTFFQRQVRRVAHVRRAGMPAGAMGDPLLTRLAGLRMAEGVAALLGLFQIIRRRYRPQHLGHLQQWHLRQLTNVVTGKGHRQCLALEPLALAQRARATAHELRNALLHQRTLRVGKGVQDVAPGAGEGALITRFHLALESDAGFFRGQPGVHRHRRRLFSEENPVALLFRQFFPRNVDIDAHGHQDVAQVLPLPRQGPGRHGALADGQVRVRHHQRFGHFIDATKSVTLRAGALRRVR